MFAVERSSFVIVGILRKVCYFSCRWGRVFVTIAEVHVDVVFLVRRVAVRREQIFEVFWEVGEDVDQVLHMSTPWWLLIRAARLDG